MAPRPVDVAKELADALRFLLQKIDREREAHKNLGRIRELHHESGGKYSDSIKAHRRHVDAAENITDTVIGLAQEALDLYDAQQRKSA